MKFSKTAVLMGSLVLFSSAVFAQKQNNDAYVELGYLNQKVTDNVDDTNNATPKAVRLIAGKNLSPNLSMEVMAAANASKGTDTQSTPDNVSGSLYGFYLKPKVGLSDDTQLFARVGMAHTSLKYDNGNGSGVSTTYSGSKLSYGIGLETNFTDNVYGAIDYMYYGKIDTSLANGDQLTSKGLSVSVGYRF